MGRVRHRLAALAIVLLVVGAVVITAPSWSARLWPPTSATLVESTATRLPTQDRVIRLTKTPLIATLWAGTVTAQTRERWIGGPLFPAYVVGVRFCWNGRNCRSVQYDFAADGPQSGVIVQWPHGGWATAPPAVGALLHRLLQ